jgi:tetratricopeptide (TPR) repeat protein
MPNETGKDSSSPAGKATSSSDDTQVKRYSRIQAWASVIAVVIALPALWLTYRQLTDRQNFTPELEKQYATLLRQGYQNDLKLNDGEKAQLDGFIEANQLGGPSVEATRRELMTKIEAAFKSIERGLSLARQKRFAEARREFASATVSDPDNSTAWADLGAADMETGRVEEGRAAYDKALLLAPDDWRTRFNFGLFFARMKNQEAALAQFEQVFRPAKPGTGPSGDQLRQVLQAAQTDPVLAGLRKNPRFQDFLLQAKHGS